MKKTAAWILCAALLCGLLSGCQNDSGAYTPTGDALIMEDGEPVQTVPKEETQELTLTYYPGESLNPLACTDYTNRVLFSLVYQGLFTVDRDYNTAPLLCGRYTCSDDMRAYTFYLAENAVFSDGTPVSAQDVAASLQSAKASTYFGGRFQHIVGFALTEDGGVTVQADTPMENMPILLDTPILKDAEVAAERPLGTGAYVFSEGGGGLCLRRKTDWWYSGKIKVTAPEITLLQAQSNTQIRDNFEFSGLDLVCANPASDRYADYRCDYELWDCETGIFLYLLSNMESEVFRNGAVRSALTYAIDRQSIVSENFRGFGRAASLPASPASPYYSQVQAEKYAFDGGDRLRQAVTENGLTGAPVIVLVNSGDTMRTRIARTVGAYLNNAGLSVQMKELTGRDYTYTLQVREYDLLVGQTRLPPNMDLSAFFTSYGNLSYGGVADAGIYALCLDSLANHGNYYSLHQAVMDDGRLCPVAFCSYAIYATRGLITELTPSRDCVFYFTPEKTMEDIRAK